MNRIVCFLLATVLPVLADAQPQKLIEKYRFGPLHSVPYTPVKDQRMSSTCWSFSSVSLLETELLKMGKGETDLSEMFIARHSMIRKIERHLKGKGKNFFTPGGQFHDAVWVMKNHGLMPEQAYSGKGRGEANHDHAEMDTLLSHKVKSWLAQGIMELNGTRRKEIEALLNRYYGPVPVSFSYKGEKYTASSFAKDYLGIRPDDYIEITSYTHHPFYTWFVLEDKYNWSGDMYWNVPLSDFIRITETALDSGYSAGWDGDADDAGFDYPAGMAFLPGVANENRQMARQAAFENETTLLNHMMHIVGRRRDEKGLNWYLIKNSWGRFSNQLEGMLYMNEDYFLMRTVAIIVNRKALPADLRLKLQAPPKK